MKKTIWILSCSMSLFVIVGLMSNGTTAATETKATAKNETPTLNVAVMDPLAVQLACKCVAGYAQRDYQKLAEHIEKTTGMKVRCVFSESLASAQRDAKGPLHLIVGKDSVVRYDAKKRSKKIRPLAALTGQDGTTTFTGIFVVAAESKAKKIEDLKGYKIFFGPEEAVEKSEAAIDTLRKLNIDVPKEITRAANCVEGALAALDAEDEPGAAAVLSSYCFALLEGCNTVEPGSLRIIGKTGPVPFVRVFATDSLDEATAEKVTQALFDVAKEPELLKVMESKNGFVPIIKPKKETPKTSSPEDSEKTHGSEKTSPDVKKKLEAFSLRTGWPQWRGLNRDACVKSLPKTLPEKPKTVWEVPLNTPGMAGIAADEHYVIVADRDATDQRDRFLCLDADSGKQLWELTYPAAGEMDYGCSPRATPLLLGDIVVMLGALGDLHAVRLADGKVLWKKSFTLDFDAKRPTWGWCGSPILVDGKIILQPGGKEASIVAIDPATGKVVWKTAGKPSAYSSLLVGTFGGVRQLVGYDETSVIGWDIKTGRRLWELVPPEEGDFNVPTPIDLAGQLLLTTENNGTRLYRFAKDGTIEKTLLAQNFDLSPDSSTAVLSSGRVFGFYDAVICLDPKKKLDTVATLEIDDCESYASLIASEDRVLVVMMSGTLILVDTIAKEPKIVSQVTVFDDAGESYSHPALVGSRLYLRSGESLRCVELDGI